MSHKLLIFGLLCIIAAGLISIIAHVSAQTSQANQTSMNETNALLKQILDQQKLQIELQQDNIHVLAIKLDIIKVELERILVQLQAPPTIPPPPPVPPVFLQPPSLNGTICKEQNDMGVLITCPVFPGLENPSGLSPPIPTPPLPPLQQQCVWGVFC